MLKKMNSYIKKALPKNLKGLDLDKAVPAKVAQGISDYNIRTNVEYALTDRFANRTQEIYGCQAADEFMMAQHRFDKENQKMPLIHDTNIINDVSIENRQNIAQSEPVLDRNQDNIILRDH